MRADCGRRNAPEPAAFRRGSLDKSQSRRRPSSRGQPPITAHCGAGQGGTACGPLWRCRVWLGSLSISVRACLSPAVGAKEDGHPAPALLLAARCLLTTLGWAGWSKFSFTSVDEQRKPQISTVRILANQGHIILRLVPIITNNSGLAPSAPPPSDQRTIAKSPTVQISTEVGILSLPLPLRVHSDPQNNPASNHFEFGHIRAPLLGRGIFSVQLLPKPTALFTP